MKTNIKTPDAATGTTTAKQEKYEKKMAKYLANKARKEQKKNEKMLAGDTTANPEIINKIVNPQKYESPISELKEIEKLLVKKARYFYDNRLTFIHFPITYKGELNMVSAVSWGRNAKHHEVTAITVNGSNERNELDELWDRVLDRELDIFCIKLLRSGKKHNPRFIKADTPTEAFEIACKENNVKMEFNVA
jgi:hypothetical protein